MDNTQGQKSNNSENINSEKPVSNRYETIYPHTIDNLGRHLLNRQLSFKLLDNSIVNGKMISFGQYDVIVLDSRTGQNILIMKSAIISVQGDLSPRKEVVK